MKVTKEGCNWCYGISGKLELFEKDFYFHRKCFEQMQEIKPALIDDLKAKNLPE